MAASEQIDIEGVSASVIGEQLNASFLDCAVCANQFSVDGERVPVQLAAAGEQHRQTCEHSLCAACAEAVFAREPRLCPLCRAPLAGYARNRLAIQLLLAAKVLQRRGTSGGGGEQDEAARLRARIADTELLLQQHSTQNESAQAELRRLQRQREEALRALEYYQREEARAAQQLADQAHQYGLTLQDLHDARQQLDYYRRDRRQVEENRRLAVLLNDEVQRLQDSLASMYEQLGTRDSDAHRWQRLYASALDDLHDKEAEVEALKRTVQQHQHHHHHQQQQQQHSAGTAADPSSWLSRAASWIRGTALTPVPGVLVQQLDQYTLHERLGAALNSSVFLAEEKDSKRRVAIKRISYTLDDKPSSLTGHASSSSSSSSSLSISSSSSSSQSTVSSSPPSAAPPGSLSSARLRKIVDVCREAMLLRVLQHDNIVSLVGFVHLPDTAEALLVMDYMPFDLQFQLANRHIGSEAQLRAVVQQLLCAVLYMHTSQAVHRAIGTTTVLLDASGRVRLAGMRDARSLHSSPLDAVHVPADVKYAYWAPELADFAADPARHRLTSAAWKAVDMWAVGVVFAEMILGEALFAAASPQALFESLASCKELRPAISLGLADASPLLHQQLVRIHGPTVSLLDRIRSSYFLTRPGSRGLSKDCLQLLFALLKFDATQRLTAAEALASPFFARADLPHYKSVANQITDAEIADFARVNLGLRFF